MITVIIATYNHGMFIKRAIKAILDQDLLIERIIIINDASIDDTYEILEEYKLNNSRIKIIHNKENLGMVNSFKIGLDYVESEFFTFASADDFLFPEWAKLSIEAMQKSPLAALCM